MNTKSYFLTDLYFSETTEQIEKPEKWIGKY